MAKGSGKKRVRRNVARAIALGASAAGPGAAAAVSAVAIAIKLGATDASLADVFADVPGPIDWLLRAAR